MLKLHLLIFASYWICCHSNPLFRDQLEEIHNALTTCKECIPADDCPYMCALNTTKMLLPNGNINLAAFTIFYKPSAQDCIERTPKLERCDDYEAYAKCLSNNTKNTDRYMFEQCQKELNQTGNLPEELSHEILEENDDLACILTCVVDKMGTFIENDEFDMTVMNLNNSIGFNVEAASAECIAKHQQTTRCQKRANRFLCLLSAYETADMMHSMISSMNK